MSDTATDGVVTRLNGVIHQLAEAGACIAAGKPEKAREPLKQANIALSALRVAFDQVLGDRKLPAKRRR
jgi:hypothetical protein